MRVISQKVVIPPLQRKVPAIQNKNVKIIVSPQNNKISTLNNYIPNIQINTPKTVNIPMPNQAISKRSAPSQARPQKSNEIKFKKPKGLVYKSQEPSPDNLPKIINLRNRGLNKILVVIGNGPSINEIDLERLKDIEGIDTLSINRPDPRIWPTNFWSFYDPSQLKRHGELIDSYDGLIFNSTSINLYRGKTIKFRNIHGMEFSRDLAKGLCISRSSCYAAMQIALYMNYSKVFFFGVDMNPEGVNGVLHFYGTNPDVNPDTRKTRFKDEAEYYNYACDFLTPEEKDRFYFCSSYNKWPFVKRFNYLDHLKSIDYILSCI